MFIMDFGICISSRPVQFMNEKSPILVTVFGINVLLQPNTNSFVSVLIMALHELRES